jgi:hypothetical protein
VCSHPPIVVDPHSCRLTRSSSVKILKHPLHEYVEKTAESTRGPENFCGLYPKSPRLEVTPLGIHSQHGLWPALPPSLQLYTLLHQCTLQRRNHGRKPWSSSVGLQYSWQNSETYAVEHIRNHGQNSAMDTTAASSEKSLKSDSRRTTPLHITPPKLARFITLVTLKNVQTSIANELIGDPPIAHAHLKCTNSVTFLF